MNRFVVAVRNEYGRVVYAYEETEKENFPTSQDNNIVMLCNSEKELQNCLSYYNSNDDAPYPDYGNGKLIDLYEPLISQIE